MLDFFFKNNNNGKWNSMIPLGLIENVLPHKYQTSLCLREVGPLLYTDFKHQQKEIKFTTITRPK